MSEILVELSKQLNNSSEKYTLYKNGKVEIEKNSNGETKKETTNIDIAKEIEKVGCMNFDDIDNMAADKLGLSLDKLRE